MKVTITDEGRPSLYFEFDEDSEGALNALAQVMLDAGYGPKPSLDPEALRRKYKIRQPTDTTIAIREEEAPISEEKVAEIGKALFVTGLGHPGHAARMSHEMAVVAGMPGLGDHEHDFKYTETGPMQYSSECRVPGCSAKSTDVIPGC